MNVQARSFQCKCGDCAREGVILPQLYVPSFSVSRNRDGFASVIGMPVCEQHFFELKPGDFLQHDAMKENIHKDMIARGSHPNWDGANLFPVIKGTEDWNKWAILQERQDSRVN